MPSASPRLRSGNHMVTHEGAATPMRPMPTPSKRRLAMSTLRSLVRPPTAEPAPRQATDSRMTFFSPMRRAMNAAGKASTTPMTAMALMSVPNVTESSAPWNAGNSHDASGGILNWHSGAQKLARYVTARMPQALPETLPCLAIWSAVNSTMRNHPLETHLPEIHSLSAFPRRPAVDGEMPKEGSWPGRPSKTRRRQRASSRKPEAG